MSLSEISTFRMGGRAREMVTVESEEDLKELFSTLPVDAKWIVIGGGSNVVFPDGDADILIILLSFTKKEFKDIDQDSVHFVLGAGVPWDEAVALAVSKGLAGIEALSFIPGNAGATPVQNVGAYGCETSSVLVSLRAYDTERNEFLVFTNADCRFGYRDSIFKHEGKGRYIITEITLALSRDLPNVPQYPGVADYLAEKGITAASLADIREAIISIRTKKLPDPREVASVGSFFKNPFVPAGEANTLKGQYPTLAVFPVNESMSKVGTGSLIDTMGWKGKTLGHFSLYKGNAMVIVNDGGGTRAELEEVIQKIQEAVFEKYGINIEPEPELLTF